MKLYLDTCSIQRPLDTLNQTRLRLEAEAILGILEQVDSGMVQLVSSTVLELEIARNSLDVRREHGQQVLGRATITLEVDEAAEKRAGEFAQRGLAAMDSLHLAVAESAKVDYFCTCDDKFLRRARTIPNLSTVILSPLELIEVLEL